MLISPSLLSADFGALKDEILSLRDAGADMLHIDVMDGHFVPNLTFGPDVIKSIAGILPLDIHLMVENASLFIDLFAPFSPLYVSLHYENTPHLHRLVFKLKDLGISPSVVLNPHTPVSLLESIIKDIDMVLLMSVNPGFSGQKFIPIYEKITSLKALIARSNPSCKIQIDGGVSDQNAHLLKEAGADILVAGSYIFSAPSYREAITQLRLAP